MESLIDLFNEYNKNNSAQIPVEQLKNNLDQVFEIHEDSYEFGIKEFTIFHEEYPDQLRDLSSPPLILYYRGDKECLLENNSTAVIDLEMLNRYHGTNRRILILFGIQQ